MRKLDLTGHTYGRLTVTGPGEPKGKWATWVAQCDCGTRITRTTNALRNSVRSCGCLRRETSSQLNTTHGLTRIGKRHYIYAIFTSARARCENPESKNFAEYGARGIELRYGSPIELLNDLGERPTANHTIDRVDPDGHYEPGNVRWATRQTQTLNIRHKPTLNECGFRGVTSAGTRFQARIRYMNVERHLGMFTTREEAAMAYDRAAIEYHGEYAKLNYPRKPPVSVKPDSLRQEAR